jgi:hypothetical protein
MRISSFVSFFGFVLIVAGIFSPILRPLHLFNLDVYQVNKPYAIVMLVVAIGGALGTILQQRGLIMIMAVTSLLLVVLLYIAALLKVSSAFSFIPFKGISAALSHTIVFKWGWLMLLTGALMALIGSVFNKSLASPGFKNSRPKS